MSFEIVPYGKGKGKGAAEPQQKVLRRTVDYGSLTVRWLHDCLAGRVSPHRLQCHYSHTKELLPPFVTPQSPYDSICCRFVHSSTTKNRAPVNAVHWFPNGRRLLSGTQTGEIIIWNGMQFHFENILQAHNQAVRAMEWTPEETVLVSGDQIGVIKFWDQYLYNFQSFQAHKESICDIGIAPTGLKFVSCADDSHAKVWDLRTGEEERAFTGHGWDVKCCAWHPTKGLVATGSKDSQIKLWDPRASEAITTIFCHKNTVTRVKWSPNGQWLASGSRDQLVMLMDVRTMSVRKVFKAHTKEVTALEWHPESEALLASGGYDSNLHFWDTHGSSDPLESVIGAHDGPIWCLAWNPLGHLLVSGSHDYSTRFWSRPRPGDSSFQEMLPRKVGAAAAEAAALAAASLPPVRPPQSVLASGIFAGAPLPPPTAEELKAQEEALQAKARAAETAVLATRTTSGLSLGEGTDIKGLLDSSDFDAEEQVGGSIATTVASVPSVVASAAPPGLKGEATAKVEPPAPPSSTTATAASTTSSATPATATATTPKPEDASKAEAPATLAAPAAEEQSSELTKTEAPAEAVSASEQSAGELAGAAASAPSGETITAEASLAQGSEEAATVKTPAPAVEEPVPAPASSAPASFDPLDMVLQQALASALPEAEGTPSGAKRLGDGLEDDLEVAAKRARNNA